MMADNKAQVLDSMKKKGKPVRPYFDPHAKVYGNLINNRGDSGFHDRIEE